MRLILIMTLLVTWMAGLMSVYADDSPVKIYPARPPQCAPPPDTCGSYDAVVFVHGIYGSEETFINETSGFNWPKELPREIADRRIDVYMIEYKTAMLDWARTENPSFLAVSDAVVAAMKPLRVRGYRTIGFIAHSLGGNVVSTYIHRVKSRFGHPQRSQHAFVITLATPVLGAQIADIGSALKQVLGMSDPLLDSLRRGNLYLQMLKEFREDEDPKERRYLCRAVNLHAAYEEKYIGPLLVVDSESAAESISNMVDSPVVGFRLDHVAIAKPTGPHHPVYKWVDRRIRDEYLRLADWDAAHASSDKRYRLCERQEFIPEGGRN